MEDTWALQQRLLQTMAFKFLQQSCCRASVASVLS
jgi:hypothetical protein